MPCRMFAVQTRHGAMLSAPCAISGAVYHPAASATSSALRMVVPPERSPQGDVRHSGSHTNAILLSRHTLQLLRMVHRMDSVESHVLRDVETTKDRMQERPVAAGGRL